MSGINLLKKIAKSISSSLQLDYNDNKILITKRNAQGKLVFEIIAKDVQDAGAKLEFVKFAIDNRLQL